VEIYSLIAQDQCIISVGTREFYVDHREEVVVKKTYTGVVMNAMKMQGSA
jgi:hypothetical protein